MYVFFLHFLRYVFSLSILPLIDHDLSSQYDSTVPGCFLTLIIAASWFRTGAVLSVGSSWSGKSRRGETYIRFCATVVTQEASRLSFFFSLSISSVHHRPLLWRSFWNIQLFYFFLICSIGCEIFHCVMNLLWNLFLKKKIIIF